MDLIFGDTVAHDEKERIVQIEAELRGTRSVDQDLDKRPFAQHAEHAV